MPSPSYVPVIKTGGSPEFASPVITGTLRLRGGNTITFGTLDDVNLYRGGPDVLQTDDYFVMPNGQSNGSFSIFGGGATSLSLGTLGGGIAIKEGANARMNRAVLVAGTVVVANTSVTAATEVMLTTQIPGGTPGSLYVSARNPGVSFTVTSTNGADTSTFAYHLIEPAA
ncbi:MAG: hypothetical protein HOV73_01815 [Streptomyces sp.]|nr:hypothetical protein [Streptomyces sp.]